MNTILGCVARLAVHTPFAGAVLVLVDPELVGPIGPAVAISKSSR